MLRELKTLNINEYLKTSKLTMVIIEKAYQLDIPHDLIGKTAVYLSLKLLEIKQDLKIITKAEAEEEKIFIKADELSKLLIN